MEKVLRHIVRDATKEARSEERKRNAARRNAGEKHRGSSTIALEERKMAFFLHPFSGKRAVESIFSHYVDGDGSYNGIYLKGPLQRLHDGVLNPENHLSFSEQVISAIENLGVISRFVFEGIPVVNEVVDGVMVGAKMSSADSLRSKISSIADFVLDAIPGYGLFFPSGNLEIARDRVDEEADMAHVKALRKIIQSGSTDPKIQQLANTVATQFAARMEQPHPYHAVIHEKLTNLQAAAKPISEAHRKTHAAGQSVGIDVHETTEGVLKLLGADTSKINPAKLKQIGDHLQQFAEAEIKKPVPMIEYVNDIIAIAPEAAQKRRLEAKGVGRLRRADRKRKRDLEQRAVHWDHAAVVAKELLDTYQLAKARLNG